MNLDLKVRRPGASEQQQGRDDAPLAPTRAMYLQALLAGSRSAALKVAREALRDGVSVVDLYVDVLQETLQEIGRLWETNRITVAHEHAATAITQFVMAQLHGDFVRTDGSSRGTVLMTGLDGEFHSVGPQMVCDVLEAQGWTVHFLGTDLPERAILDAIAERQPDCVGISATMLFNIPSVRRLIAGIRRQSGPARRIVVGGSAFRHAPDAWRDVGADACGRDLREAISLMCR